MNIVCPLCGRHVPEQVFDPFSMDDDIYAVEVRGLGRGMGFKVTGQHSVLDEPEITGAISIRCQKILQMIHQGDYVSPPEADALRASLEQWVRYGRRLEAENFGLTGRITELSLGEESDNSSARMGRLLRKINRSVSFDFRSLEEAVNFLLEN